MGLYRALERFLSRYLTIFAFDLTLIQSLVIVSVAKVGSNWNISLKIADRRFKWSHLKSSISSYKHYTLFTLKTFLGQPAPWSYIRLLPT